MQDSTDNRNAKVFRARAVPQEMCDNLVTAQKLLENQQKDGDSPVRMIVPSFWAQVVSCNDTFREVPHLSMRAWPYRQERRGHGLFLAVDNNATAKITDLEKETRSKKVVMPRLTTDLPGAVVREGADELILRAHEGVLRTSVDTTNVGK